MLKSVLKRFLKGFISGGIASVAVALKAGATISSFSELKSWGFALGVAFISGGLLALEKAINWKQSL